MTMLEQWTLWCWLAYLISWAATWSYVKPAKWKQPPSDRMAYGLLLWIAIVLTIGSFNHRRLPWPFFSHPGGVVWLGFLTTLGGLLLAIWARVTLGRNWSSGMDIKEGHELITHGPYTFIRNPIYTALLLMLFGSALVTGSIFALVGCLCAFWSFWIRIRAEEDLMTKLFPNTYPAYAKRVKRLIPFVF
ncbi:MAG TPA: isoprenylcysteine carboxylmethyltransferase family protein [Candidatus Paceibacterota bacterium]|nr:isoprenylcysteine carboxylmethyltransferase family protein [Candidatus Paceibacterota bacterium]